jgi:pimeloyl-ACP methyl ester carboxylesterase
MTARSLFALPPIWREGRIGLEAAALMRNPVYRGHGVPAGDGRPVLLIPGFMAGDGSLATMTHWLRGAGYMTRRAGIRANVSCSEVACARLEARLEGFAEHAGQKVAIVGQSRGGNFAKALAVRRPDLVSGIVTLGSAQLNPLAVHPLVHAQVYLLGTLGTIGAQGLFKHSCRHGACCEAFWSDLEKPVPDEVGYMSIYSRTDGIVDWRACLDPAARQVEVRTSHCGMALDPAVFDLVLTTLREQKLSRASRQEAPTASAAVRLAARR